ncbi:MAG: UDP-N-acetylmuramate--L-alanine ligase [Thermoanaerobaculum sp.]|nr:UDP-N-acetylmuramate--L-alanine ligase [Thermoanaerobaculum sp.]
MNFGRVRHLHFVGIGGAGMCGLAELLRAEGFIVSGCDLAESEATRRLATLGVKVHRGHHPQHLDGVDVVVVSSAIPPQNAEVHAALQRGMPVIRRAEMLGEVSRLKWTVAVAGTHGKTTTTSLTGYILTQAGWDPTVVVGGRVHFLAAHARLGRSEYLVCEADEYDRSFLALHPVLAVITNVEPEHLDTYGTVAQLEEAFIQFANAVPFYGAVVACLDDAGVRRLIPHLRRRLLTYGFAPQADLAARQWHLSAQGARARLIFAGQELGELTVPLLGRHGLANALAATAVALEMGVAFEHIAQAVASFTGVARRFEVKGTAGGVTVVDDYAHHPTEVIATLQAARQRFPGRRIVAVFQPHLFSRTQTFAREFGEALLEADLAFVLPIYPAREQPLPGVSAELVVEAARKAGHRRVELLPSLDEAASLLAQQLVDGDVVLTLGAGNVVELAQALLEEVEA